ncbi:helix-turn-helix transcriptional regulator [Streptomyces sp. NPDC049936]|uniref:helix-turn-helix transcriptional regulator n=1 Tax=Streptomyces sp. NPDC049936 TaxID=3365599 RepID=UPI0037B4F469
MANHNPELGRFLRTRRARVEPSAAGLAVTGQRRVPGLRRDELARLAGVSVDYYARLEQGRHFAASPSVLRSLARVLRLDRDEREYLCAINSRDADVFYPMTAGESVRAGIHRTLTLLGHTPAVVVGPYGDVFTANEAAGFLLGDFAVASLPRGNIVRWMLTAPQARLLYGEGWEDAAMQTVAALRFYSSRVPAGPRLADVVQQLSNASGLFVRLWERHDVSRGLSGPTSLYHPELGVIVVENDVMTVGSSPAYRFCVMAPVDGARFRSAFRNHRADSLHGQSGISVVP